MLHIQDYIRSHPATWKNELQAAPYNINIRTTDKHPNTYMFKYKQTSSDFTIPLVRESRGLVMYITNDAQSIPLSVPFFKFDNYKENVKNLIDWNTARVQEKVDGSIIKIWFHTIEKRWIMSTNGVIDAEDANVMFMSDRIKNFADMVLAAVGLSSLEEIVEKYALKEENTYIFEVVGPYNRVIVDYSLALYHLGTRNNKTLEESSEYIPGLPHPRSYLFSSIKETAAFAKTLTKDEEGYVVVDGKWNRLKIKGDKYLSLVYSAGNEIAKSHLLSIVMNNEGDEFLAYHEQHREHYEIVKASYDDLVCKIEAALAEFETEIQLSKTNTNAKKALAQKVFGMKHRFKLFILDAANNKFGPDVKASLQAKYTPKDVESMIKQLR